MSSVQLDEPANARVMRLLGRMIAQGWTQKSIADACGFTQPFVSLLLRGKARASFVFAERLAKIGGTTVADLLGVEDGDVPPESAHPSAPRATSLSAARAMAEASGFDAAWVRTWNPGGTAPDEVSPNLCWAMLQADYARANRPRAAEVRTREAVVAELSELVAELESKTARHRASVTKGPVKKPAKKKIIGR